jgi:cytochrome c oxidase subunit 4
MSRGALLATASALLALTAITVTVAHIDLGQANVVLALGIASAKATLVALFFMHLRYEHRFHLVILAGAVIFAIMMVAFIVFDTTQYQPSIREHEAAKAIRKR